MLEGLHMQAQERLQILVQAKAREQVMPCDELATWTNWMEGPDRLVLDTQFIDPARNRVRVCTAFLGVDVNFGDGEPILFETVIFGGPCDWQLYRYCTWEEAEQGHAVIVQRCRTRDAGLKDQPLVLRARELARLTVKKASRRAITSLVERSFNDY
jgi:hypothetical protein